MVFRHRRSHSSAGQSVWLITIRSAVQARMGPLDSLYVPKTQGEDACTPIYALEAVVVVAVCVSVSVFVFHNVDGAKIMIQ